MTQAATIDGAAPEVQAEFERLWSALDGNVQELTRRLDALTMQQERQPRTPGSRCVQCSGPVEPERHCYAHPTCYRCLPPPAPLPIVAPKMWGNTRAPGCVWVGVEPPTQEQVQVQAAKQERQHAPSPDYTIEDRLERAGFRDRGDGWHEPEPCSCDESVSLRNRVAELEETLAAESRVRLRVMNEADGLRERIKALDREIVLLQRAHGTRCEEAMQLRGVIARLGEFADMHGPHLVPSGADTFGEGIRAAKRAVKDMLSKVRP